MYYLISLIIILININGKATMNQETYPRKNDVETIEGIMKASYEVVSGAAGEKKQWERDKSLHHSKAIYSFQDKATKKQLNLTLSEFHQETDDYYHEIGFYESEIKREVFKYGNIAHVISSYESRNEPDGDVFSRGINSVQLYHDGNRWWIISWTFSREEVNNKLPMHFDH